MTALVFALQEEQICLAMDTLVVDADNKIPLRFQSKFISVPQTNLVVAGTGHADFIDGWFRHVQKYFSETSIDDLNEIVKKIFIVSIKSNGSLGGLTVTIYHFGYSSQEKRYVGYAYRGENDFRSEKLNYGLGFKPIVPVMPTNDISFPDFLINIIKEQQREDNSKPLSEKVGIGGEIEFVCMSDRKINVETVHRFSSYEDERMNIEKREED